MQDWVFEVGVADGGTEFGVCLTPGPHDENWLADALKTETSSLDEVWFNPSFNDGDVTDLDEVIVTGTRWPGPSFPNPPEVNPSLTNNMDGGGGDSWVEPHVYVDTNRVGDSSCDADEAWQGLLQNAAPGQQSAAETGMIIDVPGLGPVIQTVNWEMMTVTNTTMPGHLLHPGVVSRQIIALGGDIYVETVGWGTGPFGTVNSLLANDLWTAMDALIALYVDQNDDGEGDC